MFKKGILVKELYFKIIIIFNNKLSYIFSYIDAFLNTAI